MHESVYINSILLLIYSLIKITTIPLIFIIKINI